MTNIWEKFDAQVDLAGLEEDVNNASDGNKEFEDIPVGKYEVALKSIDLKMTKKSNKPMMTSTFKVLVGKYKGQQIWVNQVVENGQQISIGLRFINSMKPAEEVTFTKEKGYAGLEEDLFNAAKDIKQKYEFVLDYSENDKGYSTYKIEEVFEVE